MAEKIMKMFYDVFVFCSDTFTSLMEASGMTQVYIGLALVFLSVRMLLGPIFGISGLSVHDAGSDMVDGAYNRWRSNNRKISTSTRDDQSGNFARRLNRLK